MRQQHLRGDEGRSARLHRHGDRVGLSVRDHEGNPTRTYYLSAALAREVGEALLAYADDVEAVGFLDSTIGTTVTGEDDD